ncbi:hypothetical protein YK48G_22010 [Lentilactobacillus fungorum]|uniref:DUF1659 domain-containing protein n=1 Tax=Lentilactobacillus fungorum TaxID=2201250 RepID=A0ABQ3W326_9LACO|nr:hypothetical protein [Lentilactobacillus fungorum]GHP14776.1 hypothetical protein YK48G_22010 [Lentilactobacillus fungorum]
MKKDWLKSSVTYTLVNEAHKKGVKHSFSNVAQNVTAESVTAFSKILEGIIEGTVADAAVMSVDRVDIDGQPAQVPAAPKA